MKLILVSQNRKSQIEYNGLEFVNTTTLDTNVYRNVHSYDIVCRTQNGKEMLSLGSYATEERALEIMEEVVKILKRQCVFLTFNKEEYEIQNVDSEIINIMKSNNLIFDNCKENFPSYIVYEFPKE